MFGWVCERGFDSYPMRPWNLCTGNDGLKTVVPLIYTQPWHGGLGLQKRNWYASLSGTEKLTVGPQP